MDEKSHNAVSFIQSHKAQNIKKMLQKHCKEC